MILASILDQLGKNDQAVREAFANGFVAGIVLGIALAVLAVVIVASRK